MFNVDAGLEMTRRARRSRSILVEALDLGDLGADDLCAYFLDLLLGQISYCPPSGWALRGGVGWSC